MTNRKRNKFNLEEEDFNSILDVCSQFPAIESVLIFGSRVRGDSKLNSDIDLCLVVDNLSTEILNRVSEILEEEIRVALFFDVVALNLIKNAAFKKDILESGVEIYLKR